MKFLTSILLTTALFNYSNSITIVPTDINSLEDIHVQSRNLGSTSTLSASNLLAPLLTLGSITNTNTNTNTKTTPLFSSATSVPTTTTTTTPTPTTNNSLSSLLTTNIGTSNSVASPFLTTLTAAISPNLNKVSTTPTTPTTSTTPTPTTLNQPTQLSQAASQSSQQTQATPTPHPQPTPQPPQAPATLNSASTSASISPSSSPSSSSPPQSPSSNNINGTVFYAKVSHQIDNTTNQATVHINLQDLFSKPDTYTFLDDPDGQQLAAEP